MTSKRENPSHEERSKRIDPLYNEEDMREFYEEFGANLQRFESWRRDNDVADHLDMDMVRETARKRGQSGGGTEGDD